MKNRIILTLLAAMISFPAAVSAQNPFEAYKKQAQSQFNDYRDQKRKEFEEYRRRANEEFANYMSKEWVWNDSCEPFSRPRRAAIFVTVSFCSGEISALPDPPNVTSAPSRLTANTANDRSPSLSA